MAVEARAAGPHPGDRDAEQLPAEDGSLPGRLRDRREVGVVLDLVAGQEGRQIGALGRAERRLVVDAAGLRVHEDVRQRVAGDHRGELGRVVVGRDRGDVDLPAEQLLDRLPGRVVAACRRGRREGLHRRRYRLRALEDLSLGGTRRGRRVPVEGLRHTRGRPRQVGLQADVAHRGGGQQVGALGLGLGGRTAVAAGGEQRGRGEAEAYARSQAEEGSAIHRGGARHGHLLERREGRPGVAAGSAGGGFSP